MTRSNYAYRNPRVQRSPPRYDFSGSTPTAVLEDGNNRALLEILFADYEGSWPKLLKHLSDRECPHKGEPFNPQLRRRVKDDIARATALRTAYPRRSEGYELLRVALGCNTVSAGTPQ